MPYVEELFSNCSPVRLEIFWQFFEKPEEKKMQIQDVSLEFLQALDVAGNAKERRNTSLGASFFLEKTEARGDFKIESDIANCYGLLYLWDVSFFSSRMGEASNSKVQQDLIHIIWIWFDWYEIDIKVEVISSGIGWCYQIYLQKIHLELFCAKSQLLGVFLHAFFFFRLKMNLRFLLLHEFIRGQQKRGKAVMIFGEKNSGEAIDSQKIGGDLWI